MGEGEREREGGSEGGKEREIKRERFMPSVRSPAPPDYQASRKLIMYERVDKAPCRAEGAHSCACAGAGARATRRKVCAGAGARANELRAPEPPDLIRGDPCVDVPQVIAFAAQSILAIRTA